MPALPLDAKAHAAAAREVAEFKATGPRREMNESWKKGHPDFRDEADAKAFRRLVAIGAA